MLPPHCAPSFQNGGGAGEENVLSRERRRRRRGEEERPRRRKQRLCGGGRASSRRRSASVGLQQSEDAVEVEADAAVDATAPPAAATEQRRILVLVGEASADPAEAFLPSGKARDRKYASLHNLHT